MPKISPINANKISNFISKNNKKILLTSMLVATFASLASTNSCSKLTPLTKDKFEQTDSLKTREKEGINIIIDDSVNVIEHTIMI